MLVSSPNLPTKRALSYDERPRVVVDSLKADGHGPVSCLVQHQSELRSPLALAVSRRQKAFRRLVEEQGRSDPNSLTSPPRTELPKQIVPVACASPELRTAFRASPAKYGLAIYPWAAERTEELDAVEYGESLTIVGRDGPDWLIVQRVDSAGKPHKSGLFPTACVLETLVPPSSARTLEPVSVLSPHVIAYALVDRPAHSTSELELHLDDRLRVYFRCSHWCWVIAERTGQRGWAPGWLVSSTAGEQASLPRSSGSVSRKAPLSPGLRGA